ncbi:toxin PIN [Duganella callida]|uniref:Toxin PIN n=1 Tax=Duganella callida TaxID=2561932 RepID=A0A4Y9S8K1_9BURK|nr:toxin PIN [Duganella callida]TFW17693.1 toxin PIN [Duganella callida]
MIEAVPGCLVENYEHLIEDLKLSDANDRHVLAAAIACQADAIVTSNVRDFDLGSIKALPPDDFCTSLYEKNPARVFQTVRALRLRLRRPPKTADQLLSLYERQGLPQLSRLLHQEIERI